MSTPEDRAEQAAAVVPDASAAAGAAAEVEVPLEADPADAAEQSAVVELDEDERREA